MQAGFRPEEVFHLPAEERHVWDAIAELNQEQQKNMIRDAIVEAVLFLLEAQQKAK